VARRSRAPSPRRHPPSRKKPRNRELETAGPCPAAYPVVRAGRWKMTRAPIGGVLRSMTATPWRALAPVRRDDGHFFKGGKRKEGLRGRPHPPLRYAPHTFCLLHPLSFFKKNFWRAFSDPSKTEDVHNARRSNLDRHSPVELLRWSALDNTHRASFTRPCSATRACEVSFREGKRDWSFPLKKRFSPQKEAPRPPDQR